MATETEIQEKPMLLSPLQLERLRATLASLRAANTAADEAAETLSQAKSDRDDKKESLTKAVEEMEEAQEFDETRITGLSRDAVRADRKFAVCDREKRSRADFAKKMDAQFFKVAEAIADGQTDLFGSEQASPSDLWKNVPIADIVGDLQAMPFIKQDIHTVGQVCEKCEAINKLVKSGDIAKGSAEFVKQQVAFHLYTRGLTRCIPKDMKELVDKKPKAPPDVKEPKAEAAEEKPE